MNLLIDAHALIWGYSDPDRLPSSAAAHMVSPNNRVFVSTATHWEIAIKISIGKLSLTERFPEFIQHAIFDNGFTILPIQPPHTAQLTSLPFHHRDPFDRLIIAQAMVEGMAILSRDPLLDKYPVQRLW